jgi:hypothetical protein
MFVIPPNWRQPAVPAERIILETLLRIGGSLSIRKATDETDDETWKLLILLAAMGADGNVEIDASDTHYHYTITDQGRALLEIRPQ